MSIDAGGLAISGRHELARELAHRYRKPLLIVDLSDADNLKHARLWLRVQQARLGPDLKLGVGGPRESEAPGIYLRAATFIRALLDANSGQPCADALVLGAMFDHRSDPYGANARFAGHSY